jgi:hypothetical protein
MTVERCFYVNTKVSKTLLYTTYWSKFQPGLEHFPVLSCDTFKTNRELE